MDQFNALLMIGPDGARINGKHALEPLRPSERGPVSNSPWFADALVFLHGFTAGPAHAVYGSADDRPRKRAINPDQVGARLEL